MAVDLGALLTFVSLVVVAGVLAALAFRATRIPDTLLLIVTGSVLGPIAGVVDVEIFRGLVPVVGGIAIVIILFDGGLEMKVKDLAGGVRSGAILAVWTFAATTALCALVGHVVGGLAWPHAALLGMAFGGAGVLIVIPLVRALHVAPSTVTVVSIEAALSDVLVVLGVYALAGALAAGSLGAGAVATAFVVQFVGGAGLGLLAGVAWARSMWLFSGEVYEYVITLAVVFLAYAMAEAFHASGLIAALAFGFVVGNRTRKDGETAHGDAATPAAPMPVYSPGFVRAQHEVLFFVRAFFFVGLGALVDVALFRDMSFLLLAVLLSVAVVAGRFAAVSLLYARGGPPARDQLAIAIMFPLGLAAAALSLVPSQVFGIPGTERFGAVAAMVVVLTNVLAAAFVAAFPKHAGSKQASEAV